MPSILAGILDHMSELTYYLNPSQNSYERLGECKAPKYICWGVHNRSAIIRTGSDNPVEKVQIRSADSECNIYIALSLLIYAAIDGIEKKLQPPAPASENLFDSQQTKNVTYDIIPENLTAARKIAQASSFIKKYVKF